jgi:hypothetical protein
MLIFLVASFANLGIITGAFPATYVMIQVTGIDPKEILSAGFRALGI